MDAVQFSIWKRAVFCKVKEIKHLSGGVVLYAAPTRAEQQRRRQALFSSLLVLLGHKRNILV